MVEFRFDPEDRVVRVRFQGPLKGSDALQTVRDLARDPRFGAGMHVLADLSAVDPIELFGEDVRAASESLARLGDAFAGSRIAIVAPADAAYGVSRQFELQNAEARWEVRAFRTAEQARRWLDVDGDVG